MPDQQKYKLTERIDAGGMAEVFRGVVETVGGMKKVVAIKRILPHLTKKPKFVRMFLDEARLSLHLQHANIVQVFDIGTSDTSGSDNTYFIVMEYIDGANLRTITDSLRRQGKRMKVEHSIYIMMEVCKGLAYAHDMHDPETGRPLGIVHRDISPPNILISRQGEVKLVDFGLAKAASQLENTEPGVVKGKFAYLSPEAAEGREVDHRADIFAVGIVLFELLSGRRLFYGDTDYDTVQLVKQARIPSLRELNPEVEPQLEGVVRKALARDVVDRYQSAADLQEALAQYLFSRGMKVTSRDIAQLVQQCLREKERNAPPKQNVNTIIDAFIAEEIARFTSLGQLDGELPEGARPLSPQDVSSGSEFTPARETVDPRSWLDDFEVEQKGAGGAERARGAPDVREKPASRGPEKRARASVPSTETQGEARPQARVAVPVQPRESPPRKATSNRKENPREEGLLEKMLDGDQAPARRQTGKVPDRTVPKPKGRIYLAVAVSVLLALVVIAVFLAVKLGLIGGSGAAATMLQTQAERAAISLPLPVHRRGQV